MRICLTLLTILILSSCVSIEFEETPSGPPIEISQETATPQPDGPYYGGERYQALFRGGTRDPGFQCTDATEPKEVTVNFGDTTTATFELLPNGGFRWKIVGPNVSSEYTEEPNGGVVLSGFNEEAFSDTTTSVVDCGTYIAVVQETLPITPGPQMLPPENGPIDRNNTTS